MKVEYKRLLCRRAVDRHCQLACEFTAVGFAEDVEGDGAEVGMSVEELAKKVDKVDCHFCVCSGEKRIVVHIRET